MVLNLDGSDTLSFGVGGDCFVFFFLTSKILGEGSAILSSPALFSVLLIKWG